MKQPISILLISSMLSFPLLATQTNLDFKHKLVSEQKLKTANISKKEIQSEKRNWDGKVREEFMLTVLIEFPDHKVDATQPGWTDHFIHGYPKQHYEEMLYSEAGYTGPNGESFISLKEYFEQESGGSYKINGEVFGWYQASQPIRYYGENTGPIAPSDRAVDELVIEAVKQAINEPNFRMADYDKYDYYDFDNDGDIDEPDGIIDKVAVIYSATRENPNYFVDSIYPQRSFVGYTPEKIEQGISIYNFIVMPIDTTVGIIAHEYAHEFGLPDEYDQALLADDYFLVNSPVGYWSLMGNGFYGGKILGTEPVALSPFSKQYIQSTLGGNWQQGTQIDISDLDAQGQTLSLRSASLKNHQNDVIRVDLPPKKLTGLTPLGATSFMSPKSRSRIKNLVTGIDLTSANTADAEFMINYDMTVDAASISVRVYRAGDYTGTLIPINVLEGNSEQVTTALTGISQGWVKVKAKLDAFIGEEVSFALEYNGSDIVDEGKGFGVDNLSFYINGDIAKTVTPEHYDPNNTFLFGLSVSDGSFSYPQYYLLEWRSWHGVDKGLENTYYGRYAPGLVVWFVDTSYRPNERVQGDNMTAYHPGEGWLGVVDANRNMLYIESEVYNYGTDELTATARRPAPSIFQVKDAAFNLHPHSAENLVLGPYYWPTNYEYQTITDEFTNNNSVFADWDDYSNYVRPATGKVLPQHGLVISILSQDETGTEASVNISKHW